VIPARPRAVPVPKAAVGAAVVLAAAIAALLQGPCSALARDAGGVEVRRLAQGAAAGDRRARAEEPPRTAQNAETARSRARRLLAEERFHEPSIPRPLRGLFLWLGAGLAPVVQAIEDMVDALAALLPGGRPVGLTLLAAAVLLAFAALASRTLRLRSRRLAAVTAPERDGERGPSPAQLERAATDAERAGDLSLAVRLRFRAGLLALEEQGTLSVRASLTTAAIASRLGSSEFKAVASSFEEVAYGDRAADHADVEVQRTGWPKVLEEARA